MRIKIVFTKIKIVLRKSKIVFTGIKLVSTKSNLVFLIIRLVFTKSKLILTKIVLILTRINTIFSNFKGVAAKISIENLRYLSRRFTLLFYLKNKKISRYLFVY
jgi:hypothetical protein